VKILVAVDGSPCSTRAVEFALRLKREGLPVELALLNVQEPLAALWPERYLPEHVLQEHYRTAANEALAPAAAAVARAGVQAAVHRKVGPAAETIAEVAQAEGFDQIVMGTRGMGMVGSLVLGSVAMKLVHLTAVPVTLVR
jgi:nucleotide-binding universal stress UspA family protein